MIAERLILQIHAATRITKGAAEPSNRRVKASRSICGGSIAFARRERQEAFGNVTPACNRFSDISASVIFFRELDRLFMICSLSARNS